MEDPDVWKQFAFEKAKVVVSCLVEGQEMELGIAAYLAEHAPDTPFVATTSSHDEALELYEAGVYMQSVTDYLFRRASAKSSRKRWARAKRPSCKRARTIGMLLARSRRSRGHLQVRLIPPPGVAPATRLQAPYALRCLCPPSG